MKPLTLLSLFLVAANLADFITTIIGLQLPNVYEANNLINVLGPVIFFLIKVFSPVPIIVICGVLHERTDRWINKFIVEVDLFCLGLIFLFCTLNNLWVILQNV